jgi:predicted DsbA family dithiol-disulfide isomerase
MTNASTISGRSPLLTLNNGGEMPALGLGVYQSEPRDTRQAVEAATRSASNGRARQRASRRTPRFACSKAQCLPLLSPQAMRAAMVGSCARRQDKFWEMHELLFGSQRELGPELFDEFIDQVKLDRGELEECLPSAQQEIQRQVAEATRLGVTGTPTMFIGVITDATGTVTLLRRINGAASFSTLESALDSASRSRS